MDEKLDNSPASLICIGGLPGNGKTTIALRLVKALDGLLIDPDLTRLQLLGRPASGTITDDDLDLETTRRTLELMRQKVRAGLTQGKTVIVASSSVQGEARDAYERLAMEMRASFRAFWLAAPLEVLQERMAGREARRLAGQRDVTTISAVSLKHIDPNVVTGIVRWPAIDTVRTPEAVFQHILYLVHQPRYPAATR